MDILYMGLTWQYHNNHNNSHLSSLYYPFSQYSLFWFKSFHACDRIWDKISQEGNHFLLKVLMEWERKRKDSRMERWKKEGKRKREKLSLFKKCNRFLTLKDTSTKESEQWIVIWTVHIKCFSSFTTLYSI